MTAFPGLRGTGDWVSTQMPESWRDMMLFLFPNGDAPLTALTSRMKSVKEDSPIFHWWEKGLPTQRATFTAGAGIYINSTLGTAYVYATHNAAYGIVGRTVYVKISAADSQQFRVGHVVLLRDASRPDVDVQGQVTAVSQNGASSYCAVRLDEIDDGAGTSKATYNLATCDTMLVIGNVNSEGAPRPDSISYDPTPRSNVTQIFRNSLDLTRTAFQTRVRTGDPLKEARREGLELHGIEMEKSFFFQTLFDGTGANGKPERKTMGIIPMIKAYAPENIFDYSSDALGTGKTWKQAGEDFLDTNLEVVFRYGRDMKLGFCGSGALLGIQQLVKQSGQFTLSTSTIGYGVKVVEWVTPFGVIALKRHPLFSYESSCRNRIVLLEPERLSYHYLLDTDLLEDKSFKEGGFGSYDAIMEEYKTECGLGYSHPLTFAMFDNVGVDNA